MRPEGSEETTMWPVEGVVGLEGSEVMVKANINSRQGSLRRIDVERFRDRDAGEEMEVMNEVGGSNVRRERGRAERHTRSRSMGWQTSASGLSEPMMGC